MCVCVCVCVVVGLASPFERLMYLDRRVCVTGLGKLQAPAGNDLAYRKRSLSVWTKTRNFSI